MKRGARRVKMKIKTEKKILSSGGKKFHRNNHFNLANSDFASLLLRIRSLYVGNVYYLLIKKFANFFRY